MRRNNIIRGRLDSGSLPSSAPALGWSTSFLGESLEREVEGGKGRHRGTARRPKVLKKGSVSSEGGIAPIIVPTPGSSGPQGGFSRTGEEPLS